MGEDKHFFVEDDIMARKFSEYKSDSSVEDKLKLLKALLKSGYDWYFENTDGYCKTGEGSICLFRNIDSYHEGFNQMWEIEVYSYVFCIEGRRFKAEGTSEGEVLDKAITYFKEAIKTYINDTDLVEKDKNDNN